MVLMTVRLFLGLVKSESSLEDLVCHNCTQIGEMICHGRLC